MAYTSWYSRQCFWKSNEAISLVKTRMPFSQVLWTLFAITFKITLFLLYFDTLKLHSQFSRKRSYKFFYNFAIVEATISPRYGRLISEIREIKLDVTWSYVVFFSSNPSLNHIKIEKCLLRTIRHKYNYFHSTVQRAKDRRQKFHFCRLPFDVRPRNVKLNLSTISGGKLFGYM